MQTSRITLSRYFLFPMISPQSLIPSPTSRSIPAVCLIGSLASSGRRLFLSGQAIQCLASAISSWALVPGHGGGRNQVMYPRTCRCSPSTFYYCMSISFFFSLRNCLWVHRGPSELWNIYFAFYFRSLEWISAPPLTLPRGDRMVMRGISVIMLEYGKVLPRGDAACRFVDKSARKAR